MEKDKDYTLKYEDNINVGKAKITITGIGNYTGTKNVEFEIIEKNIETLEVQDIPNQVYTGQEIKPSIVITYGSNKLVKNTDYEVTYSNNIEIGKATVNITGKGNYTGTTSKEFDIVENGEENLQDISKLEITDIEDKTYTGNLITPEVTIEDGEYTLKKDNDYKIAFSNNTNVGTATVTITGIGNYTGKVQKKFNILSKDIKEIKIQDIEDQDYTGEKIEPEVILYNDQTLLKENEDYTVKYANNTEIGTATITIEGKGNYKGTLTKTFKIVEETIEEDDDAEYDNKQISGIKNDEMTTAKEIPYAGGKIFLYSLIVISIIISIVFYKKIKKYRKI